MTRSSVKNWKSTVLVLAIILAAGLLMWRFYQKPTLPESFAFGNGRIEATEIDIATKLSGRLAEVLVGEGEMVEAGQILARMDRKVLEAEFRETEAKIREVRSAKERAIAMVAQRESELALAEKEFERSQALFKKALIAREKLDRDRAKKETAEAVLRAARAQVMETEAAIDAAIAKTEKIKSNIDDSVLKAPTSGRVLYRLAEPGEVLSAGGKIMTMLDLSEVYMTIFLPTREAGQVVIGSDARVMVDFRPDIAVPAKVSFVAPRAQFTPKEVETRTEREKLMFKIKVKIDPELLKKHVKKVKTGVPGVAYVRLDPNVEWPEYLKVRLPQ